MKFTGEMRVVLEALDVEETVAFYRDKLGLEVVSEWERPDGRGALLKAGSSFIEIVDRVPRYPDRKGAPMARDARLSMAVDSVDEAHRELIGRGLRVLRSPGEAPDGSRTMTVLGPDGLPINIFSPAAS